jgi:N-formylglutamate deformylase
MDAFFGESPLIISLPHVGQELPVDVRARMTPAALKVPDTDWHVEKLYAFARLVGASWVEPRYSRYVVDLNRPPDDAALYPGQVSTGLCPTHSFDGQPLYQAEGPTLAEIAERRERYWRPYHQALSDLINHARARHGIAVLLDAHSIRSHVPRLFDGKLPDINLGTNDGRSCDPRLEARVMSVLDSQRAFTYVKNGRFKGGYITRHYGRPEQGVYALQIELAQAAYMDEATTHWSPERALGLTALLRRVVDTLIAAPVEAPGLGGVAR